MNLPETPPQGIKRAPQPPQEDILFLPQLENFSESAENFKALLATADEETVSVHGKRSGLRVLRASPIVLGFCGAVFISLIFLMDFTARDRNRAATVSRTSSATPAKTENLPASSTRTGKLPPNSPTADTAPAPQPSASAAAAQSPSAQSAQTAPASHTATEQTAVQQPAPAVGPPAANNPSVAQANTPTPSDAAGEGGFTLQVGSFNAAAEADERVAKLGSLGVRAYVLRVEIPKRGTWYRVQVGRFSSREEATRYGAQLRGKGAVADFIIAER